MLTHIELVIDKAIVMECVDVLGGWWEEMLPRKQAKVSLQTEEET